MSNKKTLNEQASVLYSNGDYEKSAELSFQVLKHDAADYTALVNLGNICYLQKKYIRALLYYNRARKRQPENPVALVNLAMVGYDSGRFSKARVFLQKVLKKDFRNQTALVLNGQICLAEGRYAAAVKSFKKALCVAPEDVWLHAYLGRALQKQRRFKKALDEMRRAVELSGGANMQHLDFAYGLYEIADEKGKNFVDSHLREWHQKYAENDIVQQTWNAFYPDKNFTVSKPEYIRTLFDVFAENFESCLHDLDYHAPELVAEKAAFFCHGDARKKWRILDAGCGTGLCGKYLAPLFENKEIFGVDLSAEMLRQAARKNLYRQLVNDDLLSYLSSMPRQFDLVVCADVLTYFGDLKRLFYGVEKVLCPSGIFIFTASKNTYDDGDWFAHLSGRFLHGEKYLRSLCAAQGFSILDFDEKVLRCEGEKEVFGWVVTLRKN